MAVIDPVLIVAWLLSRQPAQRPPPPPPGTEKVLSFDRWGDRTAACALGKGPPIQRGSRQIPPTEVWIAYPGAAMKTNLPAGACDPAFAPDGLQIAIAAPDGLWVLAGKNWASGTRLVDAHSPPVPASEFDYTALSKPKWSPDGLRIAYVATNGGATWIEVVDAASGRRVLTTEPGPGAFTWTQDSQSIVVAGKTVPVPITGPRNP